MSKNKVSFWRVLRFASAVALCALTLAVTVGSVSSQPYPVVTVTVTAFVVAVVVEIMQVRSERPRQKNPHKPTVHVWRFTSNEARTTRNMSQAVYAGTARSFEEANNLIGGGYILYSLQKENPILVDFPEIQHLLAEPLENSLAVTE